MDLDSVTTYRTMHTLDLGHLEVILGQLAMSPANI